MCAALCREDNVAIVTSIYIYKLISPSVMLKDNPAASSSEPQRLKTTTQTCTSRISSPEMGSLSSQPNTEDQDISSVHIVFQRHAQAISNIADLDAHDGFSAEHLTLAQLTSLARTANGQHGGVAPSSMQTGVFLPDGLTEFGMSVTSRTFVNHVTSNGTSAGLGNVYMLVSSPLTRALQTLMLSSKAFNLVGPFHHPVGDSNGSLNGGGSANGHEEDDDKAKEATIRCHPGLQEATPWPQDFPALVRTDVDGRKTAPYIKLSGGKGSGCGAVMGEEEVDVTGILWAGGSLNKWKTLGDRMEAVMRTPDLMEIEDAVREARVWLRECALKVLEAHRKEGRRGTPRIVVCLHGGIINFVTQKWFCDFKKGEDGGWRWNGSGVLRNLEVNVYRFKGLEDEEAGLEEVDGDEYYERTLGSYYRCMKGEEGLAYRDEDGSLVDQKAIHWEFILDKAREVQWFAKERMEVLERLVMWTGCNGFLASLAVNGRG
ncbi:hypothetical protein B0T17DRAFT_543654 [Bombardia bombarda]|uniref:Uncharacterized protein n=1 Tax=Bombardia bombarda TaxID=252184 RepID=A0AA39W4T3_9PEZI|nr:hypothetical protein B0T17DRAFT_543654 [Bombardia bombarda]